MLYNRKHTPKNILQTQDSRDKNLLAVFRPYFNVIVKPNCPLVAIVILAIYGKFLWFSLQRLPVE